MDDVQGRSDEHEGELKRFGDTNEECRNRSGQQDTVSGLLAAGLSGYVHGQCCAREAEHHDREEACHEYAGLTKYTGTGKEVVEVVDACNVEPEHGVQCVV